MGRETEVPFFETIDVFPSVPVSGGRVTATAQRPGSSGVRIKELWGRENIEDTITKGTISCESFIITIAVATVRLSLGTAHSQGPETLSLQQPPGDSPLPRGGQEH